MNAQEAGKENVRRPETWNARCQSSSQTYEDIPRSTVLKRTRKIEEVLCVLRLEGGVIERGANGSIRGGYRRQREALKSPHHNKKQPGLTV